MTDITTWATATAEDGRRTGPERVIAQHLLGVVKRGRERIDGLKAMEEEHRQHIIRLEDAIGCIATERLIIEAMLADLCGSPAAAPAVAKAGRTRKPKVAVQPADRILTEDVADAGGLEPVLSDDPWGDPRGIVGATLPDGTLKPTKRMRMVPVAHEPATDDALVIPAALDRRAAE